MTKTRLIHISTIVALILLITLGGIIIRVLNARLNAARSEAVEASARLSTLQAENQQLEKLNKKLNAALESLQITQSEARQEHEQREKIIKNSQSSKNWRSDPLPSDLARLLCGAANSLCDDGAADGADDGVRGAACRDDGDE